MSILLEVILNTLEKNHATDIEVLDFSGRHPLFDYSVIATVTNIRLAHALIDYVKDDVEKSGFSVRSVEADDSSRWLLLDCYEVVVHIFVGEEREFYQLEKLWADLPRVNKR